MLFLVLCTSGNPYQKSKLYGAWRIVSTKQNATAQPIFLSNRIQMFYSNNTFESKTETINGMVGANGGLFYQINDSTIVTYHKDLLGKIDQIGNTYNFVIKNDTMHFHGFYLRSTAQNQTVLYKIYIDEWWVRKKQ
jgi:hypothetical protein